MTLVFVSKIIGFHLFKRGNEMKQNIRINPIDPARENGRIYPNHYKNIDLDMYMFQSAMLARKEKKRLNVFFWVFVVCWAAFMAYVFWITR